MSRVAALGGQGSSSRPEATKKSSVVRCAASLGICGVLLACLATTCQPTLPFERPSIVPANGPAAGGTEVTIIGRGFTASSAVLFGDQAASSVTVVNDSVIRATTPAHTAGPVDVVILAARDRRQLFAQAFTFEDPPVVPAPAPTPLTIFSVALPNGPVEGGSIVTIEGTAFTAATSVFFGTNPATEVQFFSSQLLNARVPAGAEGPVDLRVINPNGDESVLTGGFTYFTIPPDNGLDSDGDGLTDATEAAGYEIAIDLFGFGPGNNGGNLVRRTVFSDPFDMDSDDDGLTDLTEFLIGSDARERDTDGDGLEDAEEVNVQLTSPVSVDTDADARGPNGDLPPNASLFDGAELVEFFDNSGRLFYGGTSPLFDDTDGDGVTDYDEFAHPFRSPLVADVPRMKVDFVGAMTMTLDISLTQGTSITDGQQYGLVESETSTNSNSNENTWENSLEFTESISASGGVSGTPPGPSFEVEVGFSATQGFTEGGSTSWTEESSQQVQNSSLMIQEEARTQSQTINGGTITAGIKVINEGNVAFTLQNLVVSGLLVDQQARDGFRAITTLRPDVNQLTLAAFDETGVIPVTTGVGSIGGQQILDLMADPSALLLNIAAFDLLDAEGRNFAFLNDTTNARTATVVIDFGIERGIETFRVATEVARNPDGTATGITIGEVLTKILNIPFETQPRTGSTDLVNFPDGVQVLTKVRDVETVPGADPDAFWVVFGTSPQSGDGTVDFQNINLNAAQSLSLVFTEDRDDDGVYKREEFMYLSSDNDPDTDGDTLDDFLEIRVGWDVLVLGQPLKHVFPDPTRINADQDFLDDAAELAAGTHPKDPDTDSDLLLDGEDNCPLDPTNVPPVIDLAISTDISGSEITLLGDVFERLSDPRCDVDAIDTIVFDWGDGGPNDVIPGNGSSDIAVDIQHIYQTQNVSMITVTATDVRGEASTVDFPVTITFPTDGLLAFYPMNDESTVDNVVRDLSPDGRHGDRNPIDARDTNNRFGAASGAFCLVQDQVLGGSSAAGVRLTPMPAPGSTNGFTIAAWIIPDGDPSGIIVGQVGFTAIFVDNGNYSFTVRDPGGVYHTITDPGDPPTQTADDITCGDAAVAANWTFYAATVIREGANTRLRLFRGDGANLGVPGMSLVGNPVAELLVPNVVITNPVPNADWQIVGDHNGFGPVQEVSAPGGQPMDGRIDDVRIYDRALVEVELNALFNEADNSSLPGN